MEQPVPQSANLIAAFQRVCETELRAVYAYVRYRVANADTAEELTAKTFLKALQRLETFDADKGELAPWIFGIARHLVADHVRAQRRWRWIPLDWLSRSESADANPEVTAAAREQHQRLAAALTRLRDRERDVLGLKFAAALTNREIARLSGLKESHVAVIVHRAVARLREDLTATGERHG